MSYKFSKKELIFPLLVFMSLMVVAIVLWNKTLKTQEALLKNEIQTSGQLRSQEFYNSVANSVKALENLKQRIEMTNGGYFQYWEEDAQLILEQNPSFKFVEWIDSSMIIRKITPLKGNEAAVGLDISKLYRAEEWKEHSQRNKTNITSWVSLTQGGQAFLVDIPVYFEGKLQGTITAGMDFTNPFNQLATDLDAYAVEIKDETGTTFYAYNSPKSSEFESEYKYNTSFMMDSLDQQQWSFSLMPKHIDMLADRKETMFIAFVFGLLLSILTSSLIYFYRASRSENKRYKESILKLRELNSDLKTEQLKAKKASKAKTEFVSNMSHEIRTPLNAILGFIEVLKSSNIKSSLKEYLVLMDISSKKLLLLVDDILEIDKIESGKSICKKERFSPAREIANIIRIYRPSIEQKGLYLHLDAPVNSDIYGIGDMGKFGQILTNLLRNALKFTENGGIHINYSERINENNLLIDLVIRDTGIGIPKNKMKSIFNRFTQVDSGLNKKHEGSGLGLYITNNLVKLMKGQITAESSTNNGTQFKISLQFPLVNCEQEAQKVIDITTKKNDDIEGASVLIVDDNKINVIVLKKALETLGIKAQYVSDGEQAVAEAQKNVYDLVFMDIHMPVMDGLEATKIIRKTNKELVIIGFSADVTRETIEKALAFGMNEYFTKPISMVKLRQHLSNYLLNVKVS
ncbi:MAG: signal transduction histidine kinase/ActR/RegA family two-component response regulator [Psychroserpens sp.]|jgi:signal transduction histidine kinase/ActR/RegA family two-component response regulator